MKQSLTLLELAKSLYALKPIRNFCSRDYFEIALSLFFLEKLTSVFLISRFLFRKSSNNGKNVNYISEDDFEFPKLIPIRA